MQYIHDESPDFAFVYFHAIDMAGHDSGWMSVEYLQVVKAVDQLLGKLIDSLSTDYTVVLLSDRGGYERSHGTDMPQDMIIPWVVVGTNIAISDSNKTIPV